MPEVVLEGSWSLKIAGESTYDSGFGGRKKRGLLYVLCGMGYFTLCYLLWPFPVS